MIRAEANGQEEEGAIEGQEKGEKGEAKRRKNDLWESGSKAIWRYEERDGGNLR